VYVQWYLRVSDPDPSPDPGRSRCTQKKKKKEEISCFEEFDFIFELRSPSGGGGGLKEIYRNNKNKLKTVKKILRFKIIKNMGLYDGR
jgi:hypothetical protein